MNHQCHRNRQRRIRNSHQHVAIANNGHFGFTKTAADAVNNTAVQFYTSIENGVHSTFDGTAFAAPVIEFLLCVVGGKVPRSRVA